VLQGGIEARGSRASRALCVFLDIFLRRVKQEAAQMATGTVLSEFSCGDALAEHTS
jgi:hypothetical protein